MHISLNLYKLDYWTKSPVHGIITGSTVQSLKSGTWPDKVA